MAVFDKHIGSIVIDPLLCQRWGRGASAARNPKRAVVDSCCDRRLTYGLGWTRQVRRVNPL